MQGGSTRATTGVIIAGYVIALATFLPLLVRRVAALPVMLERSSNARVSLAQASSLPHARSAEMHFVDLSSAVEGKPKLKTQLAKAGQYTAYSNPYAEDATSPGAIKPALIPMQVRIPALAHKHQGGTPS